MTATDAIEPLKPIARGRYATVGEMQRDLSDPDDDVLTALLCDPMLSVEECRREAAALSGVRIEQHFPTEDDLGDE